jgi:T4-like virus tail tube protein gp19.
MLPANVDTLKATINRRGGLAKSNRFAIYMSNPAGQNILTGGASGALSSVAGTALRSVVTGGGFSPTSFLNDPRDIYLLAESVTLPGRSFTTSDRRIGVKSTKIPYAIMTDDTVKMTFLLTNDYYIWKYFKSWMDLIAPPSDDITEIKMNYKNNYTTDIQIQQMASGDFVPAYSISLSNAYPMSLDAVELSNGSDDYLRCTVSMAYDNWEEQGLIDGILGAAKTTIGNIF